MPKETNTIRVTVRATNERYVYEVESNTKPGQFYRCDLAYNGGGGRCSCMDHQTRRQPAIDRGQPILTASTLCRHLKRAYWHFLQEVMPRIAAREDRTP